MTQQNERAVQPSVEAPILHSSKSYMTRILTGQFDPASFDVALATERLAVNDAKHAFKIMHDKWTGIRTEAYRTKGGTNEEKKAKWAKGRTKAAKSVLEQDNLSEDLLKGLNTIDFRIVGDYKDVKPEELEVYFRTTFYDQFAGSEDKSVGNLSNRFYEISKQDGNVTEEKAALVMRQLIALKPILGPILTDEIYEKLLHVTEARIANGAKLLKPEDGQVNLGQQAINELLFFNGRQPLEPNLPVAANPEPSGPLLPQAAEAYTTDFARLSKPERIEIIHKAMERGETHINQNAGEPLSGISQGLDAPPLAPAHIPTASWATTSNPTGQNNDDVDDMPAVPPAFERVTPAEPIADQPIHETKILTPELVDV